MTVPPCPPPGQLCSVFSLFPWLPYTVYWLRHSINQLACSNSFKKQSPANQFSLQHLAVHHEIWNSLIWNLQWFLTQNLHFSFWLNKGKKGVWNVNTGTPVGVQVSSWPFPALSVPSPAFFPWQPFLHAIITCSTLRNTKSTTAGDWAVHGAPSNTGQALY